jgi:hypothetical protein
VMERYGIDRHQAFAFLVRNSQRGNIKVRVLAQRVINDAPRRASHSQDALTDLSISSTIRDE